MSLRSFHIFLIFVATLMCGGAAWLEYLGWKESGSPLDLAGCTAAVVGGIGLVVYTFYFLKKTRKLVS
ncbi:MAG TPA: hypothetical protein VG733_02120 [Chthoniobacteraceae bacterium]|nr:hypothetical protein [Chthoniobacteraceae bacterium]